MFHSKYCMRWEIKPHVFVSLDVWWESEARISREVCKYVEFSVTCLYRLPVVYLWSPYVIGQTIIFLPCSFFLLSSFFSSPNLSGRRLDIYHSSTVYTWCVLSATLECRSEMWCTQLAGNAGCKKSPSAHHRTICRAISSQLRHILTIGKNLLNSNISSTCPHNMVNIGPLTTEIGWRVWGTPANFNGFCILAALLHATLAVGVMQTLRHWTEGATYIRQDGHHTGHWPKF